MVIGLRVDEGGVLEGRMAVVLREEARGGGVHLAKGLKDIIRLFLLSSVFKCTIVKLSGLCRLN